PIVRHLGNPSSVQPLLDSTAPAPDAVGPTGLRRFPEPVWVSTAVPEPPIQVANIGRSIPSPLPQLVGRPTSLPVDTVHLDRFPLSAAQTGTRRPRLRPRQPRPAFSCAHR